MSEIRFYKSFPSINHIALTIKGKEPFNDWLSARDLVFGKEYGISTIEECIKGPSVFLIPDCETHEEIKTFLMLNVERLFGQMLCFYYTDPDLWPKDRSWQAFIKWFDYEISEEVWVINRDEKDLNQN